jgi:hypothetical protein
VIDVDAEFGHLLRGQGSGGRGRRSEVRISMVRFWADATGGRAYNE